MLHADNKTPALSGSAETALESQAPGNDNEQQNSVSSSTYSSMPLMSLLTVCVVECTKGRPLRGHEAATRQVFRSRSLSGIARCAP